MLGQMIGQMDIRYTDGQMDRSDEREMDGWVVIRWIIRWIGLMDGQMDRTSDG